MSDTEREQKCKNIVECDSVSKVINLKTTQQQDRYNQGQRAFGQFDKASFHFNFNSFYKDIGLWSGINSAPDLQWSGEPADEGNSEWVQLHGVRVSNLNIILWFKTKFQIWTNRQRQNIHNGRTPWRQRRIFMGRGPHFRHHPKGIASHFHGVGKRGLFNIQKLT